MMVRCPSEVVWVSRGCGLLLIRTDTGSTLRLNGCEASLWELMSGHDQRQDLLTAMSTILQKSPDEVSEWIAERLAYWTRIHWLTAGWEG